MKKTCMLGLAFFVLFATAIIVGPEEATAENGKDKKAPEARDIKVHKKQLISDDERKTMDEASKGKPVDRSTKDKVPVSWASGVFDNPLPEGGERYAVVVGLANYSGTVNDLCVADAKTNLDDPTVSDGLAYYCRDEDALNIKETLVKFGYAEGNIVHLHDFQATREGIMMALDNLKNNSNLDSSDEIVFFFSGHGTSGRLIDLTDGEAVDEAIFTYDGSYIWDDELKNWADSLSVNRMVFAFDICLAGGMNDLAGANRVLAMSSGEKQSSYTYYLGGTQTDVNVYQESEGLFSHYFVKRGMYEEKADGFNLKNYSDGLVAVEESFSYTYPIVKYAQTPVLSDKFLNDLILGIQL